MQSTAIDRLQRAMHLCQLGRTGEAESLCREILQAQPKHAEALHLLGLVSLQNGNLQAGINLLRRSLKANPNQPVASSNLGVALLRLGRPAEALASLEHALRFAPDNVEVLCNCGTAAMQIGRAEQALASFERALQLKGDHVEAFDGRGNALQALKRHDEALASFDRALVHRPNDASVLNNRGIALQSLNRHEEALTAYNHALRQQPDYPEALSNRGNAFQLLKRYQEALASCDRALQLRPDFAKALANRCDTLRGLRRYEEAVACYSRLLRVSPEHEYALGGMLHSRLSVCDWLDYERSVQKIVRSVQRGQRVDYPSSFLAISDSPGAQLQCARIFAEQQYPSATTPIWNGERYSHAKIRLAYASADFHDHATAHLAAELFELHDRERFEITAISFGPDDRSEMRQRLQRAFDRFVDVRAMDDRAVAKSIREMEIDIAVDLKGCTHGCRPGIFSYRAAPIQVNYLGYPGTLGVPYLDYIVADSYVIPESQHDCYAEKVVYLPECYQVNDSKCVVAETVPGRADAGLPQDGFVFCCFNQHYKITPAVFEVWMRLLRAVPGSVLWLLDGGATPVRNLRREAAQRGIEPERLVFAPLRPLSEHLPRQSLADLFLDTLPVNAHTTASDALRAGLPVLTCSGNAFVGRVAGSLLRAVGLPELVTASLRDYERCALDLATTPAYLGEVRARLARNLNTHPLFDTDRFRRHLESAYLTMIERHQRGAPPACFAVRADDAPSSPVLI